MITFNKKIKTLENTSLDDIRDWQTLNKVCIPSDYVFLMLNLNGLRIDEGDVYEILNADNQNIVEFDEIIQLQHLEGELPLIREIEEEDNVDILSRFCPIVRTPSKILLLIGNACNNLNQIYLWNYEFYNDENSPERLHKIAENIFDLINNKLVKTN